VSLRRAHEKVLQETVGSQIEFAERNRDRRKEKQELTL
jgi:hypothetical protein